MSEAHRNSVEYLKRSRAQLDVGYRALLEQQRRTPESDPEWSVLRSQVEIYARDLESVDVMLKQSNKGENVEWADQRIRQYAGITNYEYDPADYSFLKEAVRENTRRIGILWSRSNGASSMTTNDTRQVLLTVLVIVGALLFAVLIFNLAGS